MPYPKKWRKTLSIAKTSTFYFTVFTKSRLENNLSIRLKRPQEIEHMRKACELAARTLNLAGKMAQPGTSLNEIDRFVHDYTLKHNAYPAPLELPWLSKSVCTSVNEVVTHGIPNDYKLKEGDIVNIDVTSRLNGYHGDTSKTFYVGEVDPSTKHLVEVAEKSMWKGIEAVQFNSTFGKIGEAIEAYVIKEGYTVVREYCGHGIGRGFHEDPLVLHYKTVRPGPRFSEGMCFTIEPMVNKGSHRVKTLKDKWTVVTVDGELSAQFEHTLAITDKGVEVLTDLDFGD